MTQQEIKKVIDKIKTLRQISETRQGSTPKLFDKEFVKVFIAALKKHGDNGQKIHEFMLSKNIQISCEQVQEYIRRVIGRYTRRGRPPKYFRTEKRQML